MISTTFAGGNRQVGNMFDLTTFGSDLTVTGLDINVAGLLAVPATFDVYLKLGSYVGSETTPGNWTLVSQTVLNAANPTGMPTFVDVTDFSLQATTTYGVYVLFNG